MTTAQVVEMSVAVNNSPIQDYTFTRTIKLNQLLSIVSDAKRQNAEWITQKVMCVASQLWVQSFDFEGSEGKNRKN